MRNCETNSKLCTSLVGRRTLVVTPKLLFERKKENKLKIKLYLSKIKYCFSKDPKSSYYLQIRYVI